MAHQDLVSSPLRVTADVDCAPKLPVPARKADEARLHLNAAKAALRLGKRSAAAARAEVAIDRHAAAQHAGLAAAAPYTAALAVHAGAECREKRFRDDVVTS